MLEAIAGSLLIFGLLGVVTLAEPNGYIHVLLGISAAFIFVRVVRGSNF